jgi:hypothetical protein
LRFVPLVWVAAVTIAYAKDARAASVWIDGGTLTASIASALRADGMEIVPSPDIADARATVRESGHQLSVEVVSREGATIAERTVEIERGMAPALRVVMLVIADAVLERQGPPPIAPVERRPWRMFAALEATTWNKPFQIMPALALGIDGAIGDLRLGGHLVVSRLLAGSLTDTSPHNLSLDGSPLAGALLFDVEYAMIDAEPITVAAFSSIGPAFRSVRATVGGLPSPSPEQTQSGAEVWFRAGAAIAFELGWVQAHVSAGLEARAFRVEVLARVGTDEATLDPGGVAPYLSISLAFWPF